MFICIDNKANLIATYDYGPSNIYQVANNIYVDVNQYIYIYIPGSGKQYYSDGRVYKYGDGVTQYYQNGKFYKIGDYVFEYLQNGCLYRIGNSTFDYLSNGKYYKIGDSTFDYYSSGMPFKIGNTYIR